MRIGTLDSRQSVFLEEKLTYIKGKLLEKLIPEFKLLRKIPMSMEAPRGAATIKQAMFSMVGEAKVIAGNATDIPKVDVLLDEIDVPVRELADFFEYYLREIEHAQLGGFPLDIKRAYAAQRAVDQKLNSLCLKGDAKNGLVGILTNQYFPKMNAPVGNWTMATDPQDIMNDVNAIIMTPFNNTNGVEMIDTVLFSTVDWSIITGKDVSDLASKTILQRLKETYPDVDFDYVADFNSVLNPITSTGKVRVCFAFTANPEKISLEVPLPFEQLPVQPEGLGFRTYCRALSAAIMSSYPMSTNTVVMTHP